jgi:hypothetical protein
VADSWLSRLAASKPVLRASDLYVGRAFSLVKEGAAVLGADLAVISAGLGLVVGDEEIPSYDLTFSRGGIRRSVRGDFDQAAWWRAISGGRYASKFSEVTAGRPVVLVCLSASYACCVVECLRGLATEDRLRIFGAGLSNVLPTALSPFLLPYDARLDSVFKRGTQTDFAQRAMLHYVLRIVPKARQSLADEREAVLESLEGAPHPSRPPKRQQLDDDGIRELIRRLIPIVGEKHSKMLRYVRDKEQVACEQSRFARLFTEVVSK